jgi:hypothetical protein
LHRYACWTAARAVHPARHPGYKTANVSQALTKIEISKFIEDPGKLLQFPYEDVHYKLIEDLFIYLDKNMRTNKFEFGIGAKIIAVYFKTALIIPAIVLGKPYPKYFWSIYPPIDSGVIKHQFENMNYQWTEIDRQQHLKIIEEMLTNHAKVIRENGFWVMDYEFNDNK